MWGLREPSRAAGSRVKLMRAAIGTAVILLCFSAAGAMDVSVELVSLTTPVAPFTDATLTAKTVPGAACTIVVLYKSRSSRARGLVPRDANSRGLVSWTWRVRSNTTPGRWPVIVRCSVRRRRR